MLVRALARAVIRLLADTGSMPTSASANAWTAALRVCGGVLQHIALHRCDSTSLVQAPLQCRQQGMRRNSSCKEPRKQ